MTYTSIEINKLDRSPQNVRKTDSQAALEELKASILAHGLMQNLVVIPAKKGRYHVIAGGRRLEALRALQAEGRLPSDHAVQCQIAESDQATEISLAENVMRQAMHPADEFEAFAALIGQGLTAEQVSQRFGCTERHVLQRMKLGKVAPKLLAAYRAEELSLDALMAFAITDDHKRQISVWKSLEGWQQNNARHIRQRLTDAMIDSTDYRAAFVGLDAYKAAGGTVKADLFSEAAYLEDAELLERLAQEKLEGEAEKLRAEGWGWVEVDGDDGIPAYRCRRIQPKPLNAPAELTQRLEEIEAEMEEIENQLEACEDESESQALDERHDELAAEFRQIRQQLSAYLAYDAEEMKGAGCYVSIDRDGELDIEMGLVKPQERAVPGGEDDDNPLPHVSAPAKKEKAEFSQALVADLKAYRCQAAQVEVAKHPEIAFDLLVFHTACDALDYGFHSNGPDVHFRRSHPRPSVEAKNTATERLEAIEAGLPVEWLKEEGEAERFHTFRCLDMHSKLRILAYCTALTLKPDLAAEEATAYGISLGLTHASVTAFWRPTKDNYLSRVTRDQLLAIGRETLGERWSHQRKDAKKSKLVEALDAAFADPDKHGEAAGRLQAWLPKGLEFQTVAQEARPAEAPKKGRKSKAA